MNPELRTLIARIWDRRIHLLRDRLIDQDFLFESTKIIVGERAWELMTEESMRMRQDSPLSVEPNLVSGDEVIRWDIKVFGISVAEGYDPSFMPLEMRFRSEVVI